MSLFQGSNEAISLCLGIFGTKLAGSDHLNTTLIRGTIEELPSALTVLVFQSELPSKQPASFFYPCFNRQF